MSAKPVSWEICMHKTFCMFFCILALLVAPCALVPQTNVPRELAPAIEQIDALVAADYDKDKVGSVTVGIVAGPRLVWTKSYGYADMETKRPASRLSVYRIGSITKQFTALMFLQLIERGKVRETEPVEKYFPDVSKIPTLFPQMQKITLVQLATMTSGLAREPSGPPDHSSGPVSRWEQKVMESLPFVRYAHEPGTRYLYSNIGYAILGIALGRAAGQPFTSYVEEHIIKPLGMTSTVFDPNDALRPHLVKGYEILKEKVDGQTSVEEHAGRGYRVPNGAIFSTVDDLARFLAWELGEGPSGILKRETQDANYSRVYSASGDLTSGYGLGFQVSRRGDVVLLGHGGSTAGYRAAAQIHRHSKKGVIVLASVAGGKLNVGEIARQILEKLTAR